MPYKEALRCLNAVSSSVLLTFNIGGTIVSSLVSENYGKVFIAPASDYQVTTLSCIKECSVSTDNALYYSYIVSRIKGFAVSICIYTASGLIGFSFDPLLKTTFACCLPNFVVLSHYALDQHENSKARGIL